MELSAFATIDSSKFLQDYAESALQECFGMVASVNIIKNVGRVTSGINPWCVAYQKRQSVKLMLNGMVILVNAFQDTLK